MAKSYPHFKTEAIEYILRNNPKDVLDIWPWDWQYSDLILAKKPDTNMYWVEIFEPYIEKYNLNDKYKNIIVEDVCNIVSFADTDFVILWDILEHIQPERAIILVDKLFTEAKDFIIAVPYNYPQGEFEGNIYETHHQPDLTHELFMERYGAWCELLIKNDLVGYYVKKNVQA